MDEVHFTKALLRKTPKPFKNYLEAAQQFEAVVDSSFLVVGRRCDYLLPVPKPNEVFR